MLHEGREGLDVGAEAAEAHDQVVLVLEDALEVVGDGEELLAESSIAGDTDAVFSDHTDKSATVVFVN